MCNKTFEIQKHSHQMFKHYEIGKNRSSIYKRVQRPLFRGVWTPNAKVMNFPK